MSDIYYSQNAVRRVRKYVFLGLLCTFSLNPLTHAQQQSTTLTQTGVQPPVAAKPKSAALPQSDSVEAQKKLTQQRYHYELAKAALERKDASAFAQHFALLDDYTLKPYLVYGQIKNDLLGTAKPQIDQFLSEHQGSYLAYRLRQQYLHSLAKKERWDEFLNYYSAEVDSRAMRCRQLEARLSKQEENVMADIAKFWTMGKSHPKSCDALIRKWRRKGGLSDEVAWQRFHNAMLKNKRSLAVYIAGLMSEDYKLIATEYLGVHAYPSRIKQKRRFSDTSLKTQQIISHGVKRYARKAPKDALYQWELYEARQLFPQEITVDTKLYLIKRLTMKGFVDEAESLIENSNELRNKDVVERMLREALRNLDYAKVLKWQNYLTDDAKASNRWRYWLARAQDELGINTGESSTEIYQALAKNRSFYGFLSADILNREYSLDDNPSTVPESVRNAVEQLPALQRTKELWLKGHYSEAQAEWQFATKQMDTAQLAAAGQIARKWGWHNKGIHAMIKGNLWDDLNIRFPLAYRDTVEKASSKTAIEPTFIYAIARQESAFSEKARSSAGAMGLMQLMPGTARQTAQKRGIPHKDSYLFDPEYNINLGSQYLNEMLSRFNGNRILAAAAYNAGPHRVDRWLKKSPSSLPFDVWIETIPFRETRGYVQNVLSFSLIYAYRMGMSSNLMTEKELRSPL